MCEGTNPLIQDNIIDTLCYVENHLRFLNDYFLKMGNDPTSIEDPRVMHGLCKTLDSSIDAIRFEINRTDKKVLSLLQDSSEE